MSNLTARKAALSTLEGFEPTPTSLISYQSNGKVIVFGEQATLARCNDFPSPLKLSLIVMDSTGDSALPGAISLNQRNIDIQGHLGGFVVNLIGPDNSVETLQADMVLDLNPEALISLEIPPPGYLHEILHSENLKQLQEQLLDLIGEFEKPKYFSYDASICAHGVNGKIVCTQCLDACPAGAISSLIETIEVDPYLCQGGGVCATVCPSGAIRYVYPRLADSGNAIRKMLQTFREQGGSQATVVFYAETEFPQNLLQDDDSILPVKVEELASVGADLCLSALVYGASQVVLLGNDEVPETSLSQIEQQLAWLAPLLSAVGMNPRQICLQNNTDEIVQVNVKMQVEPALYTMPDSKRNAIFQALDHLYQHAKNPAEEVALPPGAPFGSALVDEKSCTLCMACVGACPGKALQDGSNRELPELFFIEANCIQCGACTTTCPEAAITISPRMIFDRELRNRSRELNHDVPFACISCGKEFAPSSVIHKMSDKLKDHYMFKTSRALDRLKMCEDCRVADIVQDPEAMNSSFDPLN
ncbi:MAG: 4Fe-4S binding protein [Gammaproteobacteria bacterium]|nr:4Fe-4S binding protein [Gammaproteobacteria bacterium]